MDKSLVGHIALAVVATAAAFMAWQRPAQSERDPSVTVVGGSVDRLSQIDWDEEEYTVTVKHNGAVTTVSSFNKKQPDDKRNVTDFPASDKGREIEEKVAPLKAARTLGHPEGERLKELGLDAPKQSLTLHFGNDVHKLEVGDSTYGSGNFYVRNSGGEVFLVPSTAITPFRTGGAGLIERMATPITREHVERMGVTYEGQSREMVQRNADAKGKSYFTDPQHTEEADKIEKGGMLADALLRLRVLHAAESLPQTPPKAEIVIDCDDRQKRWVKIWEGDPQTSLTTIATTLFPQGVNISKAAADGVLRDLNSIFGIEKPEAPKPVDPRTGLPMTGQPKTESPKTEQPKTEQPKTEAPKPR